MMKAPGRPMAELTMVNINPLKNASSATPAPTLKNEAVNNADKGDVSLPSNLSVNILVSLVISLKIGNVSTIAPSKAKPVPNNKPNEILFQSNDNALKVCSR